MDIPLFFVKFLFPLLLGISLTAFAVKTFLSCRTPGQRVKIGVYIIFLGFLPLLSLPIFSYFISELFFMYSPDVLFLVFFFITGLFLTGGHFISYRKFKLNSGPFPDPEIIYRRGRFNIFCGLTLLAILFLFLLRFMTKTILMDNAFIFFLFDLCTLFVFIPFLISNGRSARRALLEMISRQGAPQAGPKPKTTIPFRTLAKDNGIRQSLAVFIVFLIAFGGYFISYNAVLGPDFKIDIHRNAKTSDEKIAIETSENFNYTGTFNVDHYGRWGRHRPVSLDYDSYVWASVIDSEVLNYYHTRMEYKRDHNSPARGSFSYTATARTVSNITISILDSHLMINWPNSKEGVFFHSHGSKIGLLNGTDYDTFNITDGHEEPPTNPRILRDFNYSNCFFVEMHLDYDEVYGNLAAFYVGLSQYLVLDQNMQPLIIVMDAPMQAIS